MAPARHSAATQNKTPKSRHHETETPSQPAIFCTMGKTPPHILA